MKKKIIITSIALMGLLIGGQVNASTDFTPMYRPPGIYDYTGENTYTSKSVTVSNFTYNGQTYNTYTSSDTLYIASNGVGISIFPQEIMKAGYLYNVKVYYCNQYSLADVTQARIYPGTPDNTRETYYSSSVGPSRLNQMPVSGLGQYCYVSTTLFAPKENASNYYLRLRKSTSGSITFVPYVYGYGIEEIGIYTSEIKSAINSAIQENGLATESSIETLRQQLVEAQEEATNNEIASNNVCRVYDNSTIKNMGYLGSSGQFVAQENSNNRTSNYIAINSESKFVLYEQSVNNYRYCFYDSNNTMISCGFNQSLSEGQSITIPSNARYFRFTVNINSGPKYQICSNGNQAISDSLTQDHDYNNTASEQVQGQDNVDELDEQEEELFESLDFSGIDDLDITINSNASSFIWQIADRLRQMSSKIVTLFTSILGLGIIKMILNR